MPKKSHRARDLGLRQVGVATRWIAAGAAVLTGMFAVWEARTTRHVGASTSGVPARSAPVPQYQDPQYQDPGLRPPTNPPAPSLQRPLASSGGS